MTHYPEVNQLDFAARRSAYLQDALRGARIHRGARRTVFDELALRVFRFQYELQRSVSPIL